ncbi:MAG: class I SAM-dependent methyltransferase [Wenzhouxiangella sp.]
MIQSPSALQLQTPPPELAEISQRLGERVLASIEQHGPMPFQHYMAMALYEPGLGYYVNGLHKFGAAGDFVTAPEQGQLFAVALARQIDEIAAEIGPGYTLMEPGAGSGALAHDLLRSLAQVPARYLILEPSAALREVQRQTLSRLPTDLIGRVEWIAAPPEETFDGLIVANEVLDALPVALFTIGKDGPQERCVDVVNNRLAWVEQPPRPRLKKALHELEQHLGRSLEIGYQSEICLDLAGWLDTLTRPLRRGAVMLIDYGYPRPEYYLPERYAGTLVCHYRHRAHFDPFVWPGLTDLSAFVDFSAVADAGIACGLDVAGFTTQADFLLAMRAHEAIEAAQDELTRLRLAGEFKRLIMPGEMGEKFKLIGLSRQLSRPLSGLSAVDQRARL